MAINTTTTQFGLAILNEDGMVNSEYILSSGKSSSALLMPSLDFIIRHSDVNIKDLKCVVVAIGPGSFTGLKVGLSVAKGICFSLGIPIIGVSSLEALANQVPFCNIPITAMIDSRKREYFVAQFIWKDDKVLARKSSDIYIRLDEFSNKFKEETIFIGNDYKNQSLALKEIMGRRPLMAPPHLWHIKASVVGILGLRRFLRDDFDDPFSLEPIYLRPPEIRPNPYGIKN